MSAAAVVEAAFEELFASAEAAADAVVEYKIEALRLEINDRHNQYAELRARHDALVAQQ